MYEIEAIAQGGGTFESRVRLSHVLAAPPEATVSGLPAAESCDAAVLPEIGEPVVIDWDPVNTAAGGVFKFEIIARTSTGNNTAIESCFRMQ